MNDYFRKLFDGELYPNEMTGLDTPEYKEAEKEYFSARDKFERGLSKELAQEFEKLKELETAFVYESDLNVFHKGFIIGVQLTAEGMRSDY